MGKKARGSEARHDAGCIGSGLCRAKARRLASLHDSLTEVGFGSTACLEPQDHLSTGTDRGPM